MNIEQRENRREKRNENKTKIDCSVCVWCDEVEFEYLRREHMISLSYVFVQDLYRTNKQLLICGSNLRGSRVCVVNIDLIQCSFKICNRTG